ncbi:hypothetical protein DM46_4987 [Burkholderia mallei]|nr:hypothetical protein DM46_4987 [Burkholderia mallei]
MRAHVVLRAFLRQHARKPQQPVLGRHVRRLQRRRLVRMHRAHVDHHSAAIVLVHVLERGLRRQERAVDVNRLHLLPVGERIVLDRIDDLDARVRHENVDRAERLGDLVDAGVHRVLVRHVHRHADRPAARLLDELGHRVRAVPGSDRRSPPPRPRARAPARFPCRCRSPRPSRWPPSRSSSKSFPKSPSVKSMKASRPASIQSAGQHRPNGRLSPRGRHRYCA